MADDKNKSEEKVNDNPSRFISKETQQQLDTYDAAQKEFQKQGKEFVASINSAKSGLGAIGGEVGKMINDTRLKASASAGSYPTASIIKRASKNIFEFPVFVSSSIPIDYATATNSLLEQIYASFVQMAVSQNPVISGSDKNLDPFRSLRSNVSKYLEYTDMFYAHDACHNIIDTGDYVCEFNMMTVDDKMGKIFNEAVDYQPLSEFDHYFQEAARLFTTERLEEKVRQLEDKEDELMDQMKHAVTQKDKDEIRDKLDGVRSNLKTTMQTLKDSKDVDYKNSQSWLGDEERKLKQAAEDRAGRKEEHDKLREAIDDARYTADEQRKQREEGREKEAHGWKKNKEEREAQAHITDQAIKKERNRRELEVHNLDQGLKKKREERDVESHTMAKEKHLVDMKMKAPQFMDETKINKLNTMKPLMMTVDVRVQDSRGAVSDVIEYLVGVKTHCRLVPSEILPDFAEYPEKTMNSVSRKAKWRAGEIKFIDYMFDRKGKKQAAYDSKDPNRKWYHRLYTLAHTKGSSKAARKITGSKSGEGLIPNATIIISKADVDMIESVNGIDLLKGSTAARICRELFLIAMVVIDTDAQSIKILMPDIDNDYEVHSLASVNKQLATLDTANDVSREVSKLMRGR